MGKAINLQDMFLNQVRKDGIGVTIYLMGGVQLRGNVRGFDAFTIRQASRLSWFTSMPSQVLFLPSKLAGEKMSTAATQDIMRIAMTKPMMSMMKTTIEP